MVALVAQVGQLRVELVPRPAALLGTPSNNVTVLGDLLFRKRSGADAPGGSDESSGGGEMVRIPNTVGPCVPARRGPTSSTAMPAALSTTASATAPMASRAIPE